MGNISVQCQRLGADRYSGNYEVNMHHDNLLVYLIKSY